MAHMIIRGTIPLVKCQSEYVQSVEYDKTLVLMCIYLRMWMTKRFFQLHYDRSSSLCNLFLFQFEAPCYPLSFVNLILFLLVVILITVRTIYCFFLVLDWFLFLLWIRFFRWSNFCRWCWLRASSGIGWKDLGTGVAGITCRIELFAVGACVFYKKKELAIQHHCHQVSSLTDMCNLLRKNKTIVCKAMLTDQSVFGFRTFFTHQCIHKLIIPLSFFGDSAWSWHEWELLLLLLLLSCWLLHCLGWWHYTLVNNTSLSSFNHYSLRCLSSWFAPGWLGRVVGMLAGLWACCCFRRSIAAASYRSNRDFVV